MLIPISLVWFHIVLVIFSYFFGKSISRFIEPVIVDNIMEEVYNVRTPLYVLVILIAVNLLVIILNGVYVPTFEVLSKLSSSLNGTIVLRLTYLLLHTVSFFFLPIVIRFLSERYEYKFIIWSSFCIVVVGILHFCIFSFNLILYVIKS